jgi:hypothetical protein
MGTGTKMYENKGIEGPPQGFFAYGGEPRTNLQQSNDQQMMSDMSKHMQQEAERNANIAQSLSNQMSNQMSDAGQRYQQRATSNEKRSRTS